MVEDTKVTNRAKAEFGVVSFTWADREERGRAGGKSGGWACRECLLLVLGPVLKPR